MTTTATPPKLEVKTSPLIAIKANESGEGPKTFTAIVAVFDVPDAGYDVIRKGAFERSLGEFKAAGRVIPIVWSHKMGDPLSYIGAVDEAKELAPGDPLLPSEIKEFGGLWIKGTFDDHVEDALARKVYRLMKGNRIVEFSFGYTAREKSYITYDNTEYRELRDVDIWEVGPTIKGLNPATALTGIKSLARLDEGESYTKSEDGETAKTETPGDTVAVGDTTPAPTETASNTSPNALALAQARLSLINQQNPL